MSKERKNTREVKKKPLLTPKEKRAAKKNKGSSGGLLGGEHANRRPAN